MASRTAVNEGEWEGKILDFIHSLGVLQRGSLPEVSGRLTKPDRMTAFSIFFAYRVYKRKSRKSRHFVSFRQLQYRFWINIRLVCGGLEADTLPVIAVCFVPRLSKSLTHCIGELALFHDVLAVSLSPHRERRVHLRLL